MGKVSVEGGIVARELKPGLPNDKQHELAAERKPGVRPETALARDRHARIRAMLEGRGDLAERGVKLRPGPLDLTGEGPEPVGVKAR